MTYRVYKRNGTKCIKKFESIEDAKRWCWCRANSNPNLYRIEFQYEGEEAPRRILV